MLKNRLEAFSDGVLAIVITIMVLKMATPEGHTWSDLSGVAPIFTSYALSFFYLAIYWNNHHHMIHAMKRTNGKILWANLLLLFCLSLIPFVTGWMGDSSFAKEPVILYGIVLFATANAYYFLQTVIIRSEGEHSLLARAIGKDLKGKISPAMYVTAILCAFWKPWIAAVLYLVVGLIWLVPDSRIERTLSEQDPDHFS